MTARRSDDFSDLAPFLTKWGRSTREERAAVRAASTMDEIRAFHDAMLPRLRDAIAFLNRFPVTDIPEEHRPLAWAVLAMCEIENPVYKWQGPRLQTDPTGSYTAIGLDRMVAKRHFQDSSLERGR